MTLTQKAGRVFLLSGTLVIGSVLVAMLGALGLYLMEKGRELGSTPEFVNGACIIIVGVIVNSACVMILVQIKHADHKLIPPNVGEAVAEAQMMGQGSQSPSAAADSAKRG